MVGEVTTGTGFRGALSYVQKEKENLSHEQRPVILERNNLWGDTREMSQQMRFISNGRERVSRPVLHVSINFSKAERLDEAKAHTVVNDVLKELGISRDNHQYIIVKHNDAGHPHYHAVINKVGLDGSYINTSYIKNKLMVACDKVEQEHGLLRNENRTVRYDPTTEKGWRYATAEEKRQIAESKRSRAIRDKNPKAVDNKAYIRTTVEQMLSKKEIDSPEIFKTAMHLKGVEVRYMSNKNGISGVSFRYNDEAVKGTAVGYKWSDISNSLEGNRVVAKENDLRSYIAQNAQKHMDATTLVDEAIRTEMKKLNPVANPWETWRKQPQEERQYQLLHDYAKGQMLEQSKKTAFETAQEQRQSRGTERPGQNKSGSMFDELKAKREQKGLEDDRDRKRGFGR